LEPRSPKTALATLQQAHTNISADKNGVVYLVSEDNSASGTTNRVQATVAGAGMTWSKDGTKIIGVSAGGMIGQRARISNASTADAADVTPLLDWTASNSSMQGVHIFYGEADAGDLVAMRVTGERNYFYRCHIAGIGNDTQDATNAASLELTGDENMFEQCTFGVDTTARGTAANDTVLLSGGAARNIFRDCLFLMFPDNAQARHVSSTVVGGRWTLFENCTFISNPDTGGFVAPTEVFNTTGSANTIILKNCTSVGATDWESPVSGRVMIDGGAPAGATSGLAIDVVA